MPFSNELFALTKIAQHFAGSSKCAFLEFTWRTLNKLVVGVLTFATSSSYELQNFVLRSLCELPVKGCVINYNSSLKSFMMLNKYSIYVFFIINMVINVNGYLNNANCCYFSWYIEPSEIGIWLISNEEQNNNCTWK